MPGPLPDPKARRRNAPTVESSQLPADGRKGRIPKCPYSLGVAGSAWWKWAWKLPQATKWDDGALYVVARRAYLEDMLAAAEGVEEFDLGELLGLDDRERGEHLDWLLRKLKAAAGGATTLMREMRELDNRLGLNPKALAELRWKASAPDESKTGPRQASVTPLRAV